MALRSAPIKGIGVIAFEILLAGCRMLLPVDAANIADFDDRHQTPKDTIKEMRVDLYLMNKIIR